LLSDQVLPYKDTSEREDGVVKWQLNSFSQESCATTPKRVTKSQSVNSPLFSQTFVREREERKRRERDEKERREREEKEVG